MSLELSGTTPAIKGVAGSVSAPAITGDDANTGISFPAADTIKFSAGGVEKFAITASGLSGDGSGLTNVSAGKIVQYKVAQKNDTTSASSASMVEISSDLRVTITPTSASNLIVIQAQLTANSYGNYGCAAMMKKNTASDFSGTTSNVYEPSVFTSATHGNTIMFGYINGYMQSTLIQVYETAGNTTARTYSPFYVASATNTIYLNQYGTGYRGTSTVIVMEVDPT